MFWIIVLAIFIVCWLVAVTFLSGPNLSRYDSPSGKIFPSHPDDEAKTLEFLGQIKELRHELIKLKSPAKIFAGGRQFADELSKDLQTDTEFREFKNEKINIEWAIADGADTKRRIVFILRPKFVSE